MQNGNSVEAVGEKNVRHSPFSMKEGLRSRNDDRDQEHAVCAPELSSGGRTGKDDNGGGHGATGLCTTWGQLNIYPWLGLLDGPADQKMSQERRACSTNRLGWQATNGRRNLASDFPRRVHTSIRGSSHCLLPKIQKRLMQATSVRHCHPAHERCVLSLSLL